VNGTKAYRTKRNLVSFTLVLTIFLGICLYEANVEIALCAPITTISVDPPTVSVVGNTFTISINVSGVVDLYGWEFKLRWNSTLLDVAGVTEGAFLKQGGNTFFANKTDNVNGYVLVDCTLIGDISGVTGDGILAIVEFHIENDGETSLDIYDSTLVSSLEQPIIHQSTDGYGYFTFVLLGDTNEDGTVDIYDVVTVAIAFGSKPGDTNWNPDADVAEPYGEIDIYDVVTVTMDFGKTV